MQGVTLVDKSDGGDGGIRVGAAVELLLGCCWTAVGLLLEDVLKVSVSVKGEGRNCGRELWQTPCKQLVVRCMGVGVV